MANEAVLVFKLQEAIPFTVANATGIEKGAVCKMTSPMTAIISSANNDIIAGIAASEKVASDGKTKLGIFRRGIFKMALSGLCTVGDPLCSTATAWPNYVNTAGTTMSGSKVLGFALETVSAASGTTCLVDLNIGVGGQA